VKRTDLFALALYALLALAWFSPVLATGKLLAPGDGLVEALPNYVAHRTLWEPLLSTGHPAAADPITFTWYPLAALLSWLPDSYNIFVMSAYVLAAWFMYLFVLALTENRPAGRLAAWIAGLIYGFSGFLIAHTGHPSMIHSAAWFPAVLLALERRWFLFGSFAVANLVLAGHPQIILYALCFAGIYALRDPRPRFLVRALLMAICGIGMSAMLLIPLFEFSRLTIRNQVTFDVFNTYRLPIRNLILLLFPYLFGGEEPSIYGERWSVDTERDVFLGAITLLLACIAFFRRQRPKPITFFSISAVVALLLSLGGDTPLGKLVYALPLFSQFRSQSRFLMIFQLALAVLAGFGTTFLADRKRVARTGAVLLLAQLAIALGVSFCWAPALTRMAAAAHLQDVYFDVAQPSLAVPLIVSLAGIAAVIFAAGKTRAILLSLAVLLDLASFGQFAAWRYYSPSRHEMDVPPTAAIVRGNHRYVTARGFLGRAPELPPVRSRDWDVRSLNNYGQLAIERYHSLLEMDAGGSLAGTWWNPYNRALDIAAARYIITDAGNPGVIPRFERMPVPFDHIAEDLGPQRARVSLHIANGKPYTNLVLITFLSDAIEVPQDTAVMNIRLNDAVIPLRAGHETAELYADCSSVAPLMKHKPGHIYETMQIERRGQACPANLYFAAFPLAPNRPFDTVDLEWLLPRSGIEIANLVLWNRENGDIRIATGADFYPDRFQEISTHQSARIYRNLRAQARAWIVSQVVPMIAADARRAIQTSRLPDSTAFDPSKLAIAEDFAGVWEGPPDPAATATIRRDDHTTVEIRAHTAKPGILILGDLDYPGWHATVNGTPVPIIRTNYIQRGVAIPQGDSTVLFTYRPTALYIGLAIALVSLITALSQSRSSKLVA